MTRVLMFSPQFRPMIGGAERQAEKLAQVLARGDEEVEVWTVRHEPESPDTETIGDARVIRFPVTDLSRGTRPPPGNRLVNTPWIAWQVTRALRPPLARADILHCHLGNLMTLAAGMAARSRGVPSICKAAVAGGRGDLGEMEARGVWNRLFARLGPRAFTRWVATTGAVRDSLLAAGVPADRVVVIPNGVELVPEPERWSRPAVRRFLYLGRLSTNINRDVPGLIDAFAGVAAAVPDAELAIVGEGDLIEEARTAADRSPASERVRVIGPGASAEWLAWADCLVLPSRREGLSNALLEAMAQGLPCIAYDIPPNREVLADGEAGMLVPGDDHAALGQAMIHLATHQAEAAALADRARARVASTYAIERVADQYRALYGTLL